MLTKININTITLINDRTNRIFFSSTGFIKDFQVTAAKLSLTLTSELIREGKPSDSDMMSQVRDENLLKMMTITIRMMIVTKIVNR